MVNPLLYVPNLIDYVRVAGLFVPLFTYRTRPLATVLVLAGADLLDMMDGFFARKLHQTSFLGACLDMAADRVAATIIGFMAVSVKAATGRIAFIVGLLTVIDLLSHWLRYSYACKAGEHHKTLRSRFWLLDFYYGNKLFLTLECVFYEAFLIGLYAQQAGSGAELGKAGALVAKVCAVPTFLKALISVLQFADSVEKLAKMDAQKTE